MDLSFDGQTILKSLPSFLSFFLVFDSTYTHIPAYNTSNFQAVYTMLEALKIDLKSLGTSGPPVCMGDGLYEICVKTETSILTNILMDFQ